MSHLLSCQSISKAFGVQRLFTGISFGIFEGERLGLIGPNGAGKSTLLKIFADLETLDEGKLFIRKKLNLVYLAQAEKFPPEQTVLQCLLSAITSHEMDETARYAAVQRMAGKCGFTDTDQRTDTLSGGWQKRLAIGRALIQNPDLLLMDEPTNHLDMDGILWLEGLLKNSAFAFVLISHDRYFLDSVTNCIVELNPQYPGGYLRVEGSLRDFLVRKEELLTSQAKQEEVLANKLRREVEWLSRGPKARTTKAKFRIDDAARLKGTFQDIKHRNAQGRAIDIGFEATDRKTKKLLTADKLGKSFAGRQIFSNLDLQMTPKLCVGVLGNNGSGKSTLINILAGNTLPDQGEIKLADGIKIVLFDQKRQGLNQDQTLRRALAPDGDTVLFKGQPVHVVGWAKRFLFRPEQLDMPVNRLSGGEQSRILIANLMRQPADILLLDEPTNDLDIPSLEVLEEGLAEFPGAIVLVSHDRFLLDRLADFVLGFDGNGKCRQYADFRQWLDDLQGKTAVDKPAKGKSAKASTPAKKKKMTLGEELELAKMEETIAQAEKALAEFQDRVSHPDLQSDQEQLVVCCQKLQEAQEKVTQLYKRWEELEAKQAGE
ncbi:MAG: ABC-F family ATP-binding cassette domain-containing protein [Proteobacteria bacterium]|nr:ABC-F family ATP-binding cassette domain-containing protein [Desulfobulbaceae bacterium]MBU4152197.1 ABC-F family ATP-binding cassette domain-containing protein [Pseudomonadota bacterium]